ncbi:hypothetical protein [Caudoviricetes sp.]|nr:hypothetical protein [Caudoviricetes sp.]
MAGRAARVAQSNAIMQQLMERERMQQALNSPFVQNLMGELMGRPEANVRPEFSALMPGAVQGADVITPQYPSKMGVPLPPGALGGRAPKTPNREYADGGEVQVTIGEPGPFIRVGSDGTKTDSKGRRVLEISGANWTAPEPERKLLGGRLEPRGIPAQPQKKAAPQLPPMTPEQFAILQQVLPQLTQRRVAQEQSASAEDRKYAELQLKQVTSQMQTGFNIWKSSIDTAAKMLALEKKLAAKSRANPSDRRLRDLVPLLANTRSELDATNNRIAMMMQSGFASSVNPDERAALAREQERVRLLSQSADAIAMQYAGMFNEQYESTVPTRDPGAPIPQRNPNQGTQPQVSTPGGLTPQARDFIKRFGG